MLIFGEAVSGVSFPLTCHVNCFPSSFLCFCFLSQPVPVSTCTVRLWGYPCLCQCSISYRAPLMSLIPKRY